MPDLFDETPHEPEHSDAAPHGVPGQVARNVAPAKPVTASVASPRELVPCEPVQISLKMRLLLGRSTFRDPAKQVEAEALLGVFLREFGADTVLQAKLVDRVSTLFVEVRQAQSAVQTAIVLKRGQAAREILMPNFNHFYPPALSMTESTGTVSTAFGQFMSRGGKELVARDDADVIAEALAELAKKGMGEEDLDAQAYILALPTINQLERLIATKQAESDALIDQLFRIRDRRLARSE